jgi:hypothetical protein
MAATRQSKLISIYKALLHALYEFSRASGAAFDNVFDQALRDFLKKHGQPASLKEALLQSTRTHAANDPAPRRISAAARQRSAGNLSSRLV